MATDKRINYSMQGHKKPARNYLGKQKTVKNIPIKWKSGPKAPETELAYITKAEKNLLLKKDLHGSLKHGPNTGPDGIMSLDTQGDYTPDRSPAGTSGGGGDYEGEQAATQQAARQKAVLTGKIQRDPTTGNWEAGSNLGRRENLMGLGLGQGNINIGRSIRGDLRGRRSRLSGILGTLGRGALSIFGGIPGRVASGFMTAKNLAKRTGAKIGEFGETDEEGNPLYPTWDRYINRNTGKYDDKPYRGQGQGYNFSDQGTAVDVPFDPNAKISDTSFEQNIIPADTNIKGGTNFNDFQDVDFNTQPNNEIFTDQNLMAFKPNSLLDQKINQAYNAYNETGFGKGNVQTLMDMDIKNKEKTGDPLSLPANAYTMFGAQGGRAGYQGGELVEDESMMEATPAGMMEENIEEVQGEPSREQLEAIAFEIFRLPLEELDEQQLMVVYQAAMEQEPSEEEVQFAAQEGPGEGIASLV